MNRTPNSCFDCDHCINTSPDRYGEAKPIREPDRWTCIAYPREGVIGVVNDTYVMPNPYLSCWKIRLLCPRSCPVYRKRIPGQRSLNLKDHKDESV